MAHEEVVEKPYVGQIRPFAAADREAVHVVNLGELNRKDERTVSRNDELAVVEPCHALNELDQLQLHLCGQGILRLVEEVKAARLYCVGEILEAVLAVGVCPFVNSNVVPYVARCRLGVSFLRITST